jgi:4'-phosphopantetheinyl transferase
VTAPFSLWLSPPAHPTLSPDEVHVWLVHLAVDAHTVAELAASLPQAERERAYQFRNEAARTQFVVTRSALRSILSVYLDVSPLRIEFVHGPQGKPALANFPGLHFNVTHSADVALVAVTRIGEVGVDVERVRPFANDLGMAERYFSPGETTLLRSLIGPRRSEAFFHAWTRKEAYLKASGKGLSYGLERVEVTLLPEDEARFLRIDGCERLAAQWSLHHLVPAVGCVGAVTIEGHDYRLRCWHWDGTHAPALQAGKGGAAFLS